MDAQTKQFLDELVNSGRIRPKPECYYDFGEVKAALWESLGEEPSDDEAFAAFDYLTGQL